MNNNLIPLRIWSVISCLLFVNALTAKVNPQPGENLWRLTARIGDCVDVADTKLDLLASQNDLICSKVEEVDDDLFTHNDVVCSKLDDITSVVDSTQEGVEAICSKVEDLDADLSVHDALICSKIEQVDTKQDLLLSAIDGLEFAGACETLIFQSDIPFTISNPGVYCLAESVNFATGTAITIASDNVVLDLQEKKIDGASGGDVGISINSGLQNIIIQNGNLCNMNDKGIDADATNNIAFISMSISDSLIDSVVDIPALIAPISCLQIKDIKVLNVGQFKLFPIISVVDSLIDSIIDTPDCVLSPITGIYLNCVNEAVLENCKILNCFGDGFALQAVENGILTSCQAIKNGGNGFVLDNTDTSCFKWCKANMNCLHGFCDSACNGDNAYLGCLSKQNGIHGFNIAGGGKTVKECIACQNTRDGFYLSSSLLKDGDLDTMFGDGGKVVTDLGETDFGNAIAVQKNGKVVVAGQSGVPGATDFALVRYNNDGSLDKNFGIGGKVITSIGARDGGNDVAIQKDGKIVVAGLSAANGGGFDFALARYNNNGNLDPTFGTGGKVITDFGSSSVGKGIAIQKDDKIVVVGSASSFFGIARYNKDGILDTTFGVGGMVTTGFGDIDTAEAVVIQKNGKIVVAGTTQPLETADNVALARYNIDGSLDVTFGIGGKVTTDFSGGDSGNDVALQKDGKIVVAGSSSSGFILGRYNTDGNLDVTFGIGGKVITSFGLGGGEALAIQKDGKIIIAGSSNSNFALIRYNTDGSLDDTFGVGGKVATDFGLGDFGNAIILQKNGKVVVAGESNVLDNEFSFAVARYVVLKKGIAVQYCVAEENGEDGFNIAGKAYNVHGSTAIHNVADGFLLDSLTDSCQLLSNEALQNNNVGIENLGVDNQILNNRAHDNTNGNYAGVSLVTTPTLSTGFWANVEA